MNEPRTFTEDEVRAALQAAAVQADDEGESAEVSVLCDVFCQTLFGDAHVFTAEGDRVCACGHSEHDDLAGCGKCDCGAYDPASAVVGPVGPV